MAIFKIETGAIPYYIIFIKYMKIIVRIKSDLAECMMNCVTITVSGVALIY